jgi:polyisoprenoid-binding protein YceI
MAAIWLLAHALPLPAEEWVATFDPAESEVTFVLQATGHQVRGVFSLESGEIRWDSESGVADGTFVVNSLGGETGNAKRDRKMHAEVLESSLFPHFSFRPERLEGNVAAEGSSTVQLVGTLSVHGGDHTLTVDAAVEAADGRLEAIASFPVPYVEWGLRDPSVFVLRVAKSVSVVVELSGTLHAAERPASEHHETASHVAVRG